jgi:glutamate carboxypeptidase
MTNFSKSTLDWIDAQDARMRRLITQWANLNTGSYNLVGLAAFSQMLRKEWEPLGGAVEEIALPDEETIDSAGTVVRTPLGKALRFRKRPDPSLFQVFFCIHRDTVYPVDGPFQKCELLDANTLRGPGVADAKGGLAIMLIVVEAIEQSELAGKIGWEVLINPDEEIGSSGSSFLFDEASKRNNIGLLFEPAIGESDLVSERGGSGGFVLVIHGRSAHVGRDPQAGRNAIHAMAEMIVELSRLTSDNVTINVGKVEGGGPVNVVPDLAICRFNVRVRTADDQQYIMTEINRIVETMRKRDGIRVELHGKIHRPPKPLNDATKKLLDLTIGCGRELGLTLGHRRSGGVSDGNQLAASGLVNLDSLGPRGGKIHSPEEFLLLDSLTERAKLAFLTVARSAGM